MKQTIGITGIFLMLGILCSSGIRVRKNQIYGTWESISMKADINAAPQKMSNRIQTFGKSNTFESHIKTPNGMIQVNGGVFYIINDTTFVTYHEMNGKIETLANTYNFRIKNDSLHFYGYFLRPIPQNKTMLLKVYMDEWWVRTNSH